MRNFIVKTGLVLEKSNKTGYAESRYMHLTCPICGVIFNRPPSHVARNKGHTTCSRACAAEARKVRVETHCVICGKSMELTPCDVARKTTCSKECSTLRRTRGSKNTKPKSLAAYKKRAKEIAKTMECKNCGTSIGPWVVRGLEAEVTNSGKTIIGDECAELWCRHCHLSNIAPLGFIARYKDHGY